MIAREPAVRPSGSTTLVGLIGDPVCHSLSPQMQNAAFQELGLDWVYVPLRVAVDVPGSVARALRGLAALSFRGANVTIPHKTAVSAAVDRLTDVARRAGSVNTVIVEPDGSLLGDSTDGLAVVEGLGAALGGGDLPRAVTVLGAGGSARAAAEALARAGCEVAVLARRREAASALVAELGLPLVTALESDPGGARLVVNCTPLGGARHPDELPAVDLDDCLGVCDLAYRPDGRPTPLADAAAARGVPLVDGLEVLVRQGAASFEIWTGVRAPLEVMRASLLTV